MSSESHVGLRRRWLRAPGFRLTPMAQGSGLRAFEISNQQSAISTSDVLSRSPFPVLVAAVVGWRLSPRRAPRRPSPSVVTGLSVDTDESEEAYDVHTSRWDRPRGARDGRGAERAELDDQGGRRPRAGQGRAVDRRSGPDGRQHASCQDAERRVPRLPPAARPAVHDRRPEQTHRRAQAGHEAHRHGCHDHAAAEPSARRRSSTAPCGTSRGTT